MGHCDTGSRTMSTINSHPTPKLKSTASKESILFLNNY